MSSDFASLLLQLADRLTDDIALSKTREEHIRVTARANEAFTIYRIYMDSNTQTVIP
jgi:hypothetical protein